MKINSQINFIRSCKYKTILLFFFIITSSHASDKSFQIKTGNLPQNLLMDENLTGSSGSGDQIGIAISTSGSVMAVGAGKGKGHGQVHMYDYDGSDWMFSQTLEAQDATYGDFFGTALAISDDRVIIGAYHDNVFNVFGATYVFQRVNGLWQQIQKIQAAQLDYESHYGQSIVAHNDWLFISAKNHPQDGVSQSGLVEVFKWINGSYQLQDTLFPQTVQFTANFGAGLAANDAWLMIGAVEAGNDELGEDQLGRVFVYNLNQDQWEYQYKIGPQNPSAGSLFGYDLDLDSDRLAVSSPNWNGSVTLFKLVDNIWTFEDKIISNEDEDWYAYDLDLEGDNLYVGSLRTDGNIYSNTGAVFHYQFDMGNWTEVQIIRPIVEKHNGGFGSQVKLIDDKLMVGGYAENGVSSGSGVVNVFTKSIGNWEGETQLNLPSGITNRYLGTKISVFGNEIISTQTTVENSQRQIGIVSHELVYQNWVQSDPINEPVQISSHHLGESIVDHNASFMALGIPRQDEVLVYQKSNDIWLYQQSITSPNLGDNDFGKSISLSGNKLAIGSDKGVFVFEENGNWIYQSTVWESSSNFSDFGKQIKLSENRIMVLGKRYDDNKLSDSVMFDYQWKENQWVEQGALIDKSIEPDEYFGSRFDWSDNMLVLVSDANINSSTFFGAVYTYRKIKGQWIEQNVFYSDPNEDHIEFASSAILDMPFLFIGSPDASYEDEPYGRVGIYKYTSSGWSHLQDIQRSQSSYFQEFGSQISLMDQILVVGVPRANNQGTNAGAIQLIDVSSLDLIFENSFEK